MHHDLYSRTVVLATVYSVSVIHVYMYIYRVDVEQLTGFL